MGRTTTVTVADCPAGMVPSAAETIPFWKSVC